MDQVEVSVVIPTYNRAYCIERAIDSVLGQSYTNCRAIVIDDGSSDGTRDLVARRYGDDPRVVYEYQANRGVCGARNRGLALATGAFIAFLDSDDTWLPWKVELQVACLRNLPESVGMVWTDMDAIDSQSRPLQKRYLKTMYSAYERFQTESIFKNASTLAALSVECSGADPSTRIYWGDIFSEMVTGNLVHTSTALLRRERALRVGPFNESLRFAGEDFDYHLRTCSAGSVAFVDVASILYRVGDQDQLTGPAYSVHIAENYLKTIEPVIERERGRIHLPESTLRLTLARAHRWIAEAKFNVGAYGDARRHAWQSLTRQPGHRRTWVMLGLTLAPAKMREAALNTYRARRRRQAGTPG